MLKIEVPPEKQKHKTGQQQKNTKLLNQLLGLCEKSYANMNVKHAEEMQYKGKDYNDIGLALKAIKLKV